MKKALVTGATGQVGSYLIEYLLKLGYEVHGLVRRKSGGYTDFPNILHLIYDETIYRKRFFLHAGDLCDTASIYRVMREVMPDECYHMGANADVAESFLMDEQVMDVNATGTFRVLNAIKTIKPDCRMYFAGTSELFGRVEESPQNERSRMTPQSPYSIAKLAAYHAVRLYREAHGLFVCTGMTFNHESPRRGEDFLTRKVTKAVARIKAGQQKELRLGNLAAKRDWGSAEDYVEAFHLMLQQEKSEDYVIGTGEAASVQDWVSHAFGVANLDWKEHVVQDERLFRPAEVDNLLADSSKIAGIGWKAKMHWKELCEQMVAADIDKMTSS